MQKNTIKDASLVAPSGSGGRKVRAGDTLASIAEEVGHHIVTLTEAAGNEDILGSRTKPNILLPGDRLKIPPIRRKEVSISSESKHTFRKVVGKIPSLRLVFMFNDEPRAAVPYMLIIDGGQIVRGVTDANGVLEEPLTYQAKKGIIRLEDVDCDYEILLGHLDPVKTVRGVSQRLANLGFDCDASESGSVPSDRLREAIRTFNQMYADAEESSIDDSGASDLLDNDLFEKLEMKHCS